LRAHSHLSKEGFGAGLTPAPFPSGPRGPETLKAEEHIFENGLQNKKCSAGCKLTWAAQGTSASIYMNMGVQMLVCWYVEG